MANFWPAFVALGLWKFFVGKGDLGLSDVMAVHLPTKNIG